jgi:hypothetical protein
MMQWNTTGAIVYTISFVALSVLVYLGKVDAHLLGILIA